MTIRGRLLGIDYGAARIGVAVSDPDRILATPVETVPSVPEVPGTTDSPIPADIRRIVELVSEYEAVGIIVGLPRGLSGENGKAAAVATDFADRLRPQVAPVPITLVDERLTTIVATQALRASAVPGRKQRRIIDQAAAVGILQGWLDRNRGTEGQNL